MGIGEEHFENVTLAGGSETDAAAIVVSTITEDHEPVCSCPRPPSLLSLLSSWVSKRWIGNSPLLV